MVNILNMFAQGDEWSRLDFAVLFVPNAPAYDGYSATHPKLGYVSARVILISFEVNIMQGYRVPNPEQYTNLRRKAMLNSTSLQQREVIQKQLLQRESERNIDNKPSDIVGQCNSKFEKHERDIPGFVLKKKQGWAMSNTLKTSIATQALTMVYWQRNALEQHCYTHEKVNLSESGDPAHVVMPALHRLSSLLKR